MAFSGTPVVKALGPNLVRISGATLIAGGQGVISLPGGPGDVLLPAGFPTAADQDAAQKGFTLSDLVDVRAARQSQAGVEAGQPHIDKINSPFQIVVTNASPNDSGPLEIYVQYLHSLFR